ncbi:MAG: ATP-binding protein [Deltaproteobacteria bacterium]|nr:ATP-binding protein [Deltaproteobacteria bacterium]MBW2097128.1 ATP-binding protein [Deltaproteobacteria bacterium]
MPGRPLKPVIRQDAFKALHKGKTDFAIGLGVKAVEAGHKVLFITLEPMISRLTRARCD